MICVLFETEVFFVASDVLVPKFYFLLEHDICLFGNCMFVFEDDLACGKSNLRLACGHYSYQQKNCLSLETRLASKHAILNVGVGAFRSC